MKKRLRQILSVTLAAVMIFCVSAIGTSAETTTVTSGYYTYTVDENGNATITDVDTSISGDVTIPSTLDGYSVTAIESGAFDECCDITSVIIPDCITTMNARFNDCIRLEYFRMPMNLEYKSAFSWYKRQASEVTIGNGETTIKWSADDETTTVNLGTDFTDFSYFSQISAVCRHKIEKINLSSANNCFKVIDGVLYDFDVTVLWLYPTASENTSYVMPDTVIYTQGAGTDGILALAENLTSITLELIIFGRKLTTKKYMQD